MKKKEIIIPLFIYCITFLTIALIITNSKYCFGSLIDFENQHYLIPDYFRKLFYSSHSLLPDFASNLGGGQNIYYFSYYGLLSPIILLSYLFPHMSMLNYLIISSSLIAIISSFMIYIYLRKNKFSYISSLIVGFIFLCSGAIIFQAHRHIMFMNYMPFLILGMFGIDKYIKEKNGILLIISITLMIFTSYYYSIGGMLVLFIFGIYKYLLQNKFQKKDFLIFLFKFSLPFIISIFISAIITIPTLYALLSGRSGNPSNFNFLSLLMPNLNFNALLYSPYAPGLTSICVISLVYFLTKGNKNLKLLCLTIILIFIFPLFNFILNGTLYIDPKSLIPFLPLCVYICTLFIDDLFKDKIEFKQIKKIILILISLGVLGTLIPFNFKKDFYVLTTLGYLLDLTILLFIIKFTLNKNKKIFIAYIFSFLFLVCTITNLMDNLMPKEEKENDKIINEITKTDSSFYRINNYQLSGSGLNRIVNTNQLLSTTYSSSENTLYNEFYYDIFNNPIPHRNRAMISPSINRLFNIFMGEKYIITDPSTNLYFDVYMENKSSKVYLNKEAFPLGFASSNLLNKKEFDKLTYPNSVINLMNNIIIDDKNVKKKPHKITKQNISYEVLDKHNLNVKKEENAYKITAEEGAYLKLKLNENVNNKILFIRVKNNYIPVNDKEEFFININNQINKLSTPDWKYYNENIIFDYVIYNTDILNIEFSKGKIELKDLEFYVLDYKYIKKDMDPFNITKISDNGIKGNIQVKNDGYFTIQIPYDKGFQIKLDDKIINYENVNAGFLGFKISKGYHNIEISFTPPLKNISIIISLIGIFLFIIYCLVTKLKK